METTRLSPRTVKKSTLAVLLAVSLFGGWLATPEGRSQAPASVTPNASLAPLLARLKAQQDLMAANQDKIEAQSATLKEELHQAKIYASRSGSGRR